MTTNVQTVKQKSWAETPPSSPPVRHVIGELVENQTWLDEPREARNFLRMLLVNVVLGQQPQS